MNIRTLIVDDEPLARERIRSLLQDEADIEVIGECGNGDDAAVAIQKLAPDLVFLDIQMPGKDGFAVLQHLEHLPVIVFVTAYDQHALRAFEVHALDYLLKPFKQSRFKEALQRAREAVLQREAGAVSKGLLTLLGRTSPGRDFISRVAVKTDDRTVFVKMERVDYVESAGNYLVLHSGKENHVVRETLTAFEAKLDPREFVRISRSMLVNVDQIKELQPLFKGEHVVILHNGKQLPLTRGVRELEELLKFS